MTSPLNEKALEAALRAYGHECNSEETYDGAVPAAIRAYLSALPVVSDEEVAGLIDKLRAGTVLASYGAPVTYGPPAIQSDAAAVIESLLSRAQAAEAERDACLKTIERIDHEANREAAELTAARAEIESAHQLIHEALEDDETGAVHLGNNWFERAVEALRATKKDA